MKKKIFILFLILIPGIILDQITKWLTREYLAGKTIVIIKGVLELTLLKNTGAAWGSFSSNTTALIILTLVMTVAILIYYFKLPSKDNKRLIWLELCLGFIIAGAIGNMIDRIYFKYVTDMIYFKLINFPVFNIADIYVTCACFVMVILILFYYKEEELQWKKNT